MYHPKIVEKRFGEVREALRASTGLQLPLDPPAPGRWEDFSASLKGVFDPKRGLKRPLTTEEEVFIVGELTRCKVDFRYWLERYAYIKTKEQTLTRVRLFESQEVIYDRIGKAELDGIEGRSGDGVMLLVLKARQLGASTLVEGMLSHRVFFFGNTTALVAADVDEQSAYLFDMMERYYENLPWWMQPEKTFHVKDRQLYFGGIDSLILVRYSRAMAGGSTDERGRGQMGRGKTIPLSHLSELATWENPDQIDDSIRPAIPRSPRALSILESTARGRGNWWHDAWLAAKAGVGRYRPVFIPWYAETKTYRRPAPVDWSPSPAAVRHAERAREVSSRWCGKTIDLDRDQLYWWETERNDYLMRNRLSIFLAEYAADDMECFQNTTASIFPTEFLHESRLNAKPVVLACDVKLKKPKWVKDDES